MLRSVLRAFAVALVVLAVPVQGFAAVSAGICMAFGHHDEGAAAHGHDSPGEHQHDHDAGAGDQHHEGGHCAPCVSCCAATAIASYPPLSLPGEAASPLVHAPAASFQGVAPPLPDRPPLAL